MRRALGFDRPPIQLDERKQAALRDQCAKDVREKLKPGGGKHLDDLLHQATDDYQEQDRRADRAERRASSIQAAVATLLGLMTAGGSILISSGVSKDAAHRLILPCFLILIVITLILTAVRALAVQATQHDWVRPNAARYVTERAGIEDNFEVEMLATLMAAATHNSTIADWKYKELQRTAKSFRVALAAIVSLPTAILVIALIRGA
jgi:hypothetical protein